jgi:hypothetical protein
VTVDREPQAVDGPGDDTAAMTPRHVHIDGLRLVYDDEGHGAPLVFLHGSMGSALYWEGLVPLLLGD